LKKAAAPFTLRSMLGDRSYMRDSGEGYRSAAMTIFWAIIVAFFLQAVDSVYNGSRATRLLALTTDGFRHGYVWQFLTFQFLHNGFWHLLFNLISLWSFARPVEIILGTKRFLIAYFSAGAIGGLCQVILGLINPHFWGSVTLGASAGISGIIAISAMIDPHGTVSFWGFPMRAKPFVIGFALFSLFGIIVPFVPWAHAAHLGGILAGFAFVRWFLNAEWTFPKFRFRQAPRPRELVGAPAGGFWKKTKGIPPEEDIPSGDFISKEVDPILDKIHAHGLQSLTEQERRILEAARSKMSKR
jgi:membrane associated rhomboid family serine protease